jgi:hypothetical protein
VGLRLEAIDFGAVPWQELDAMPDRTVFQTREWLLFVQATQKATPVVAALRDGSDTVGYFTGLVARKLGIKVLGSPFPGWTTSYMGFNLRPGVVRREAMAALPDFAFEQLRCMHLEFMDRQCTPEDYRALGWEYRMIGTFEVDLTADEETIFRRMKQGSCRWSIRKAAKSGVVIAEASDDAFAEEYYAMLQEVFAKQGLVPTYGLDRVRRLIHHMCSTGRLLLLRARSPDGASIATGIFPAYNTTMTFWGGASWRQYQKFQPNEAVIWHAMRYWKERGMQTFDMCGGGEYKRKYGGRRIVVPWGRLSRYRIFSLARRAAAKAFWLRWKLLGRLRNRGEEEGHESNAVEDAKGQESGRPDTAAGQDQ